MLKGDSNPFSSGLPFLMVRHARIVLPGVAHHVTQRGNDRQDIFFGDGDRRQYLAYLRESAQREGVELSAYCLMTNHVHLVVTPEREDSLARALGRTHLLYAQYVFKAQGRSGHLWQSRFYSCALDEAHAHNAAAYVELNPVRAAMVSAPWEYAWSSAAGHCGVGGDHSGMLDFAESADSEAADCLQEEVQFLLCREDHAPRGQNLLLPL